MIRNRLDVYSKIAHALTKEGAQVQIYLDTSNLELAEKNFNAPNDQTSFIHDAWSWKGEYSYESLAYANNLPEDLIEFSCHTYEKVKSKQDLIITNTPSSLLRKKWKHELICHYELGIFNRNPFKKFHQFDPIGYYHNSILAKYPTVGVSATSKQINDIENQRGNFLELLNLKTIDIGSIDATYIPIPSDNWTVKTEINFNSKIDYILNYAETHSNELILTNEKPGFSISDLEKETLTKKGNIQFVPNEDNQGVGSKLSIICKKTHTFSPSLGLQTIFWGNELNAPIQSSMIGWACLNEPIEKLASYLDEFHLDDFQKIPSKIEIWNKYNPYKGI
jgi:hypothetical protein